MTPDDFGHPDSDAESVAILGSTPVLAQNLAPDSDSIPDLGLSDQVNQVLNSKDFMDFLQLLEVPELPEHIRTQLDAYVKSVSKLGYGVFDKLSEGAAKNLALLHLKTAHFIDTRDTRVDEINSPECREAREIKAKLYPFDVPNLVLCLDGRVLSKLIAGLRGHAYRTPAGDSSEFVPGEDGAMFLKEGYFSHMIDKSIMERLEKNPDSPVVVYQMFDSHIACAAKGLEMDHIDLKPSVDGGLREDVMRKKEMVKALEAFADAKYANYPQISVLGGQFSFDIHNGYLYMGLETDEALATSANTGYTHHVLDEMTAKGQIISTKDMAENSELTPLFQQYWFDIDYETRYPGDTLKFFEHIDAMKSLALPIVEAKLLSIYPEPTNTQENDVLRQKAVFLLSNAYSGYLFNHKVKEDGTVEDKEYPYAYHDESLIAIIYSERGPYDRARAFSNDPKDPNRDQSIELQESIIRGNRGKGMMSTYELKALFEMKLPRKPGEDDQTFAARVDSHVAEVYKVSRAAAAHHGTPTFDPEVAGIIEEYRKNPIPVMFFERLDEKLVPTEADIDALHRVDWSDLSDIDWEGMSDEDFDRYVAEKVYTASGGKTSLSSDAGKKINELRHRAIELYAKPGLPTTKAFLAGRLVPVWMLADKDRKTISMIPFVKKGYAKSEVTPFQLKSAKQIKKAA